MSRAASLAVLAYGLMLVGVGAIGIFTVRWELDRLFDLSLGGMQGAPSFASQYGFLKALELGAGSFCLLLRREIVNGGSAAAAFLVLVAGGIAARALAWAREGRPSLAFIIFLLLELLVLVVFILRPSQTRAR